MAPVGPGSPLGPLLNLCGAGHVLSALSAFGHMWGKHRGLPVLPRIPYLQQYDLLCKLRQCGVLGLHNLLEQGIVL